MSTSTTGHRDRAPNWPVPAALIALSAIPLTAGTFRLIQLAGGPELIPADHRFTGFPAALVIHILGAALFALIGAFQFVPRIRRRHRTSHRRAGRVVVVAGVLVSGSALWLTLFYPAQPGTGDALYVLRLVFGTSTIGCLVLGFAAIRRRNINGHRAWMMRGYALALGAGTQVFTEGIGGAVFGTGELRGDLAKGAGWVLNLAVAEWAIRRPARARRRHLAAAPTPVSNPSPQETLDEHRRIRDLRDQGRRTPRRPLVGLAEQRDHQP